MEKPPVLAPSWSPEGGGSGKGQGTVKKQSVSPESDDPGRSTSSLCEGDGGAGGDHGGSRPASVKQDAATGQELESGDAAGTRCPPQA